MFSDRGVTGMNKLLKGLLLATVATTLWAPMAFASLDPVVGPIRGNDCNDSGGGVVAGRGFNACTLNGSPVIIRFNTPGKTEINPLFPSVTGSEFTFVVGPTGTWTYTPDDATDPAITGFVAKGGPAFMVFNVVNFDPTDGTWGTFSGNWTTPVNPANDKPFGLSHLTFFDSENTGGGGGDPFAVPAPAALALFGLGLLGLGLARRRRAA
jgi:hypothetical protein